MTGGGKDDIDNRYEEGEKNSHKINDPTDNLSLADRAKLEKKIEKAEEEGKDAKLRPTEVALSHGNKPSKGAIIDQQIEDEERAELERKGKI